jgi:hypothetical protein
LFSLKQSIILPPDLRLSANNSFEIRAKPDALHSSLPDNRMYGAITDETKGDTCMATEKQRTAARKNIKKAAHAARKKRTIAHLPKSTRTALGKQASKVANEKRHRG